ncbi:MAG: DEAD/DEAH box helicase family protein, partial [Acidobacteriota bacterium]|nr:DEAD/DEAH box helicase family protein [Acidobacteriota bacterium]
MATPRRRNRSEQPLRFNEKLVLNQWILSLFEVESFAKLSEDLKKTELEGYDENNVSLFYHELTQRLFERGELSSQILLAYDENIFKHTHRLNERRREPIRWKYFQYLSLLFTEIYLDRLFSDEGRLLADLNQRVADFNSDKATAELIAAYERDDLRKVAVWSATGSGKTLLMHVNILQYRFYLEKHGREREMNRIILLTPNEGLSRQHLEEFQKAGMAAELFNPESGSLFAGHSIEIIDTNKLGEEKGEKRVAVESFLSNNLVLVDEGHRGTTGDVVRARRNQLSENGFSFEYSATFSQAVAAAPSEAKKKLTNEYAKAIIFDYSYRHFYHDGYGKDYRILNLAEDRSGEARSTYLAACLLAFYQQLRLFDTKRDELVRFLIEKPLWIFVGGSVTKEVSTRDVSDVVSILQFLNDFLKDSEKYIKRIDSLTRGTHELLDRQSHRLFQNTFTFLVESGLNAASIYSDVLKLIFNAPTKGALHVEQLKGTSGEIALRVGAAEPFGVINVGDSAKLYKKCEEAGFDVSQKEFSGSL